MKISAPPVNTVRFGKAIILERKPDEAEDVFEARAKDLASQAHGLSKAARNGTAIVLTGAHKSLGLLADDLSLTLNDTDNLMATTVHDWSGSFITDADMGIKRQLGLIALITGCVDLPEETLTGLTLKELPEPVFDKEKGCDNYATPERLKATLENNITQIRHSFEVMEQIIRKLTTTGKSFIKGAVLELALLPLAIHKESLLTTLHLRGLGISRDDYMAVNGNGPRIEAIKQQYEEAQKASANGDFTF